MKTTNFDNIERIWVLTNHKHEFLRTCKTREIALKHMRAWRDNMLKSEMFAEVSKVDALYAEQITFNVLTREGKTMTMKAREEILYTE